MTRREASAACQIDLVWSTRSVADRRRNLHDERQKMTRFADSATASTRAAHAVGNSGDSKDTDPHIWTAAGSPREHILSLARLGELQRQNLYSEIVLENISQGVCLFDAEERLVICNERYATLYGLSQSEVRPGTTLRKILARRVARGIYGGGSPSSYIAEEAAVVVSSSPSSRTLRLTDGRMFSVKTYPLPGGGCISIEEDVTDLYMAERAAKEAHAEVETALGMARTQNAHFDVAVNNMTQGLCLFDSQMRVVMANRRYAEIYSLSLDEVAPGRTLREILEARAAKGHYSNIDAEKFIRDGIAGFNRQVSEVVKLADGRIIFVVRRPLPNGCLVSTHEDITERQRLEARIQHLTDYDSVTGLPKRNVLCKWLESAIARTRNGGVVVLSTDLDRFKEVNEVHGHAEGDRLVAEVARRFRSCVQDGGMIAHIGDDEFVIAAASADPFKYAEALAGKLTECLTTPIELNGGVVYNGVSIGIAVFPNDGADADHLLRHADQALRRAQDDGRGKYHFFEHEAHARMLARRDAENDLRCALQRNEFMLHYQPLVNLTTNEVSGCEALLRWMRPGHGVVAPLDFIPLAETTGLIVPIGRWVLHEACAQAMMWPDSMKVAVNLSAIQFKSPDLVQTVLDALEQSGLAPSRLELEITESILLNDTEATLRSLRKLSNHGVRLALDDFGTGYSSLSYLRKFPFNKIKIDRSFVSDLSEHNAQSRAILRAVVQLGASLGMEITAEGVETDEQLAIVQNEGCTELQGYVFCPPRSALELSSCGIIRSSPAEAW